MNRIYICVLGVSCAEPFKTDRHNLDGVRILEASVHNGIADAVIWSGEGPYHSIRPTLQWFVDGALVGEGYGVSVPDAERYELEVQEPDGTILYADVVPGHTLPQPMISRFVWSEEQDSQEYSIEARSAVVLEETSKASSDMVVRLQANIDETQIFRWSASGGTLRELSASSTDLFFDTLHFEEDILESREEGNIDRVHVFLLGMDREGGTSKRWIDVDFSGAEIPIYNELMLPLLDSVASGLIQVDFVQTEDGFVLENPIELDEIPQEVVHPCMAASLFDMYWLRQGRCSTSDLHGVSIVMEIP